MNPSWKAVHHQYEFLLAGVPSQLLSHRFNPYTKFAGTEVLREILPAILPQQAEHSPSEPDVQLSLPVPLRYLLSLKVSCHWGNHSRDHEVVRDSEGIIYKTQSDGIYITHPKKTWEKLLMIALAIVAMENPADVTDVSSKNSGQFNDCQEHDTERPQEHQRLQPQPLLGHDIHFLANYLRQLECFSKYNLAIHEGDRVQLLA
ncbi:hypothetical protein A6R68_11383 [Neotoma lepida]|uniref:Uncharacterized protein n=1 Tax=Neotoma lepida TaxID=56216 RepID=A0A1A6FWB9_NEOLE|nr:hypothetical protein A6R68_11383 [Neotoma lepida]